MSDLDAMNEDASEIKALKRIVWRSTISARVERFSELLEREDFQKSFVWPSSLRSDTQC